MDTEYNPTSYTDQTGIFDPSTFDEAVILIGCGGIGASLLPTLVTMGVKKFVLYDPDFVEPRNLASQVIYCPADLYKPKVTVCKEYILKYCPDAKVEIHKDLFTDETSIPLGSVVIGAVDSMKARQKIWKAVAPSGAGLYLDGRIGGEQLSLFAVEPFDGDWYEKRWLFGDEAAVPLPCTARAIVYPAVALGALMCRHLAKWHTQTGSLPNVVTFTMNDLFFMELTTH